VAWQRSEWDGLWLRPRQAQRTRIGERRDATAHGLEHDFAVVLDALSSTRRQHPPDLKIEHLAGGLDPENLLQFLDNSPAHLGPGLAKLRHHLLEALH